MLFLTNQTVLPAPTICDLYKSRWQVELFFKWIKQHLRIKQFYGTSENAVKTQIWIAVSVYVLAAIVRKRLKLDVSLYTLMQVFSVTVFEKASIESIILQTVDSSEPVMGKRGKTVGKQVRHKLTVDRGMAEINLCCYARNRNDTVSREIRPHFCPSSLFAAANRFDCS